MNLKKVLMLNAAALSTLFLTVCGHNAAGQGEQEQTLHLMEGLYRANQKVIQFQLWLLA